MMVAAQNNGFFQHEPMKNRELSNDAGQSNNILLLMINIQLYKVQELQSSCTLY